MTTVDLLADWIGETLTHHMLEASADTVLVLNADDRIVLVSRAAARLNWARDELIGTEWGELVHPCDRDDALARPADRAPTVCAVRVWCGDAWVRTTMVRYHGLLSQRSERGGRVSLVVLGPP